MLLARETTVNTPRNMHDTLVEPIDRERERERERQSDKREGRKRRREKERERERESLVCDLPNGALTVH